MLFVFVLPFVTTAQLVNLIPDSSFEEVTKTTCKDWVELRGNSKYWSQPTGGTSDLFSDCYIIAAVKKKGYAASASMFMGSPMGYQAPHSGYHYAGAYLYYGDNRNYTEYITTKLVKPLEAGKKYCIAYYLSPSDKSGFTLNEIGTLFYSGRPPSDSLPSDNMPSLTYLYTTPSIINKIENADPEEWLLCGGEYIANGGESDVLIGAFGGVKSTRTRGANYAYYFFDDVSVYEVDSNTTCRCDVKQVAKVAEVPKPPVEVVTEKPFIIPNLNFDIDKWDIKPASFSTLDSVAEYIKTLKSYRVEISGHTDDVGDNERNLKLSENRAKAVADYLISKSIHHSIVSYQGYGETAPLVNATTPAARAQNRRVEIKLVRQ